MSDDYQENDNETTPAKSVLELFRESDRKQDALIFWARCYREGMRILFNTQSRLFIFQKCDRYVNYLNRQEPGDGDEYIHPTELSEEFIEELRGHSVLLAPLLNQHPPESISKWFNHLLTIAEWKGLCRVSRAGGMHLGSVGLWGGWFPTILGKWTKEMEEKEKNHKRKVEAD